MDFKLSYSSGSADMTWDAADSIANNIWLSLNVRRGSFFALPEFGHRFDLLKKNVVRAPALAEQLAAEALQWLLDTGRATSIELTAKHDPSNFPGLLLLSGNVMQADGRQVPFEQFVEVI